MQTKPIAGQATGTPFLERIPSGGGSPERTAIADFPFSIGRSDTADLQIKSTKVSREHAVIEKVGQRYRVSDLGSTNGTFVNGQKTDQAELADGDMLVIADEEFSFYSGAPNVSRQTATIVMDSTDQRGSEVRAHFDVVRGVRCLQEMLSHRAVENLYQPIVCLETGETFGYEAIRSLEQRPDSLPTIDRELLAIECRVSSRLHHLHRLVAVEEASGRLGAVRLFLRLHADEIGTEGLGDMLAKLRQAADGLEELVVQVPESAVCDTRHFLDFYGQLRDLNIAIAYDGFAYGKSQVLQQQNYPADYLKLAESVVRGVQHSASRRRQLESVVEASRRLGSQIIATGVHNRREGEMCRELNCRFAQGRLAGEPTLVHRILEPSLN